MQADRQPEGDKIISPFAHSEASISPKKGSQTKILLWGCLVFILLIAGSVGGVYLNRYLTNPYRTLEPFPVEKYLDSPHALEGSKFKADLRVEADLGWKDGVGRLMLFSTADDPRPLAVMVPAIVGKDIYFTKGQTYTAEFEIKEGGLIYAISCQKN